MKVSEVCIVNYRLVLYCLIVCNKFLSSDIGRNKKLEEVRKVCIVFVMFYF